MPEKVRYENVDVARGLAMLVVMSWHCLGHHYWWSDGWTMPVFFFIMGMFYKQEASIKTLLLKKLNTIIIPMALFSLPDVIIWMSTKGIATTCKTLLNPYATIHPGNWFFICIIGCYLIYYVLHKLNARLGGGVKSFSPFNV